MRYLASIAAFAGLMIAGGGAAQATPFDLEGISAGFYTAPLVVTDGGLVLTITADGGGKFLSVNQPVVPLLGNSAVVASFTDPLQIDQFSPIRFSFNQSIDSITFNFGDTGGDSDSPVIVSAFSGAGVLLGTATASYPAADADGGSLTLAFAGARYFIASSGVAGNNADSL